MKRGSVKMAALLAIMVSAVGAAAAACGSLGAACENGGGGLRKNPMPQKESRSFDSRCFSVVQWNIGHFAFGRNKYTEITAKESAARSAAYRAMIQKLNPDFLGISEFEPVFDKAGRLSTNEIFSSFPTKVIGPKNHYQSNALFTHLPCVRHEIVNCTERRQRTYFIDAVFMFGTNEVHFVQSHLDWALVPDKEKRPPTDRRFAQRQIKQLVEHFKDKPYVIVSADFNVSQIWHFRDLMRDGYVIASKDKNRHRLLDNIAVKGFRVKKLFFEDVDHLLSDHTIAGCVLEMKK